MPVFETWHDRFRRPGGAYRHDGGRGGSAAGVDFAGGFFGFARGDKLDSGAEFDGVGDSYWGATGGIRGAGGGGGLFYFAGYGDRDGVWMGLCEVWEVAAGGGDSLWHQAGDHRGGGAGVVEPFENGG